MSTDDPLRLEIQASKNRASSSFLAQVFDAVTGKYIGAVRVERHGDMSPANFDRFRRRLEATHG